MKEHLLFLYNLSFKDFETNKKLLTKHKNVNTVIAVLQDLYNKGYSRYNPQ